MKTPHKHAEVIKAWADGAQIQCRSVGATDWHEVEQPTWLEYAEYRIKPETRKGWYRVALMRRGAEGRYTATAGGSLEMTEAQISELSNFIRWLTPRTEYEMDVE